MKWTILSWLFLTTVYTYSQTKVQVLDGNDYKETVKINADKKLVDLTTYIPNIVLDIRYATTSNFTGQKLYDKACAFVRMPVAEKLLSAQREFNEKGVGIIIYDAYRPYTVTVKMFEVYPDINYVAHPDKGSRHNRGCAIDMGLIDLKTQTYLKMPTEYDTFSEAAWPRTPVADPEIRANKELIISVMEKNGFKVNGSEWWHFDFIGWHNYEVLDVSYEQLLHD